MYLISITIVSLLLGLSNCQLYSDHGKQNETCEQIDCRQPIFNNNNYDDTSSSLNNGRYQSDSTSIIYELLKLVTPHNVNDLCFNEMQLLKDAVRRKDVWAMKGK